MPSLSATTCAKADGHGSAAVARVTNRHVVTAGSLIVLFPNLLFAWHLKPFPAAIVLVGILVSIALIQRPCSSPPTAVLAQPLVVSHLAACCALSLLLLVFGGEGHLMFANWDWLWRDSVLADVARAPFLPTYQVGTQTFFLRAPLGMYMAPALVARATSLSAGHVFLLLQNAALLTLVLYMLAEMAGRRATIVMTVFLSFSGLDVVGEILMWLLRGQSLSSFVLPSHIESWTRLQYSSVITQLFWVPNHALPAYWLTLLVFLCAKRELEIGELGVVLAGSLFWSPFAFMGILPFAAYLLIRDARTTVVEVRFWLAGVAALCFLPVAVYMSSDAAQVPHEFILFKPLMPFTITLFLLIEIPHLAFVRPVWSELDPTLKGVLFISIVVLIVLPTVRVGVGGDLVMRASIPALMVLAFFFAQALCVAWGEKRFAFCGAGLVLIMIGAVTPMQEIIRAWTFSPFAASDCNLVTVWKTLWPEHASIENYLARQSIFPSWLVEKTSERPLQNQEHQSCWPGIPYSPRSNISAMSNDMLLHSRDGRQSPHL